MAQRQLAERAGDGIVVRLIWDDLAALGEDVFVEYRDEQREVFYVVYPPRDRALEAFYHPNAYCADTSDELSGTRAA
jgi:hypothetical protein